MTLPSIVIITLAINQLGLGPILVENVNLEHGAGEAHTLQLLNANRGLGEPGEVGVNDPVLNGGRYPGLVWGERYIVTVDRFGRVSGKWNLHNFSFRGKQWGGW